MESWGMELFDGFLCFVKIWDAKGLVFCFILFYWNFIVFICVYVQDFGVKPTIFCLNLPIDLIQYGLKILFKIAFNLAFS